MALASFWAWSQLHLLSPLLVQSSRIWICSQHGATPPSTNWCQRIPTDSLERFTFVTIRDGRLEPAESATITGEASRVIRDLAGQFRTSEIHLLLRCPWTVALNLGRTLNTFRVHLYEWEDGPNCHGSFGKPRYLPSLIVRSGSGGSPIEAVSLPRRS